MTQRFVWQELKKLVDVDHQIISLRKKSHESLSEIEAAQQDLPKIEKCIAEKKALLHVITKQIHQEELVVSDLKAQDEHKKVILEKSRNPREYSALEKELEVVERDIDRRENILISLFDKQSEAQQVLEESKSKHVAAQKKITDLLASKKDEIAAYEDSIAEKEAAWEVLFSGVPEELGKVYREIRSRIPDPVVPIISGSCSCCFSSLLPTDVRALTKKSIIRCSGCYRFLFIPDAS